MTEDKDNGVWPITIPLGANTAEVAMISCLSEGKILLQFFYLFLSSAAKRWQHFIQHRGVALGVITGCNSTPFLRGSKRRVTSNGVDRISL